MLCCRSCHPCCHSQRVNRAREWGLQLGSTDGFLGGFGQCLFFTAGLFISFIQPPARLSRQCSVLLSRRSHAGSVLPQTLGHPPAPCWAEDISHPSPTLLRDHLRPPACSQQHCPHVMRQWGRGAGPKLLAPNPHPETPWRAHVLLDSTLRKAGEEALGFFCLLLMFMLTHTGGCRTTQGSLLMLQLLGLHRGDNGKSSHLCSLS